MGTRTTASASARSSSRRPHASLPNTHAVGRARSGTPSGAVPATSSRSSRSCAPAPSAASTASPAARNASIAGARSTPVTTGRWNSEPAVDRTTLGLCTSTLCAVSTTASAPTASAARITVPAFPGSRTWARTATSRGGPREHRSEGVRREGRDRDDLLGVRAHRGEHLGRPDVHPDVALARGVDDLRVALRRRGGDVHVLHVRGGHGLAHRLRALDDEPPRALAHGPSGQRAHGLDALGAGVGQDLVGHGDIMPGVRRSPRRVRGLRGLRVLRAAARPRGGGTGGRAQRRTRVTQPSAR